MKLKLALGVAAAAWLAASAASPQTAVFVGHGGMGPGLDADDDGWITRAEAQAGFARMFDAMDSDDNGVLNREDHGRFQMRVPHGRHGAHAPHAMGMADGDCERSETSEDGERRVTVICRSDAEAPQAEGHGERHERRVVIMRHGDELELEGLSEEERRRIEAEIARAEREMERHVRRAERDARRAEREAERAEHEANQTHRRIVVLEGGPGGPAVAIGAHAPMFAMLHAGHGEADVNNDGALSREEFVAQHLRFFDASDVNGDGRLQAPAQPPEPPEPPAPPEPPRHN